jgi:glycine C-acetyltransferase
VYGSIKDELLATLAEIDAAGLYKRASAHHGAVGSRRRRWWVAGRAQLLRQQLPRLADDPDVVEAAKAASTSGASAWRRCASSAAPRPSTPCSRSPLGLPRHRGDDPLFSSCFDANGGVFEVLFGEDAIISDELNHASIIDGCAWPRPRATAIATPTWPTSGPNWRPRVPLGLASGSSSPTACSRWTAAYAPLPQICDLAEEYGALVLVDDSHAVGFVGQGGRGTPELFGVADRVDIITGTLGKALGGASGGYVSRATEIVDLLRQRSRPYLFSNSVAPASSPARWPPSISWLPGSHPITPVMFPGEDGARQATMIADHMLGNGVYVIAFSFPVVPKGKARIRVQLSAAHSEADVRACVAAFVAARDAVG